MNGCHFCTMKSDTVPSKGFDLTDSRPAIMETCRMQLTAKRFQQIANLLPRQRGNVSVDSLRLINAILYIAANGCKWRALPKHYGNWHTIYARMMRWSRSGVLNRIFDAVAAQPAHASAY